MEPPHGATSEVGELWRGHHLRGRGRAGEGRADGEFIVPAERITEYMRLINQMVLS